MGGTPPQPPQSALGKEVVWLGGTHPWVQPTPPRWLDRSGLLLILGDFPNEQVPTGWSHGWPGTWPQEQQLCNEGLAWY